MPRALILLLLAAMMAAMAPSVVEPAPASWSAPHGAVFDSPEHGWQTACDEARSEALPVCPAPCIDRLPAVYGTAGGEAALQRTAQAEGADLRQRIRHHFQRRHVPRMRSGDPPSV